LWLLISLAFVIFLHAVPANAPNAPKYSNDRKLGFPNDYRSSEFLSFESGMTYGAGDSAPQFTEGLC
jgi:hypothetical protein